MIIVNTARSRWRNIGQVNFTFKSLKPLWGESSIREMSRVKTRFTMPPFWQPKKTRVLYPEHVTKENEEFVKQHIQNTYDSPLKAEIYERAEWTPKSYRCGLITKKIGVYPMWKKDGTRVLSTLLHVSDNHVVKYIPPEELEEHDFRYHRRVQKKNRALGALVLGADSADPRLFTKEYFRIFETSGVMPKRKLSKFYITPNAILPPGLPMSAAHYRPGDFVDCTGTTIDRGFQGVMKRWGFHGQPASHGQTKTHRRPGNIGGGAGKKARVWPGTKMPGHMGRQLRTIRGVEVIRVNTKYNVIWLLGPNIFGEVGNYVILYDSLLPLKQRTEAQKDYFPTYFPEDQELPENLYHKDYHEFGTPSITFPQDTK